MPPVLFKKTYTELLIYKNYIEEYNYKYIYVNGLIITGRVGALWELRIMCWSGWKI